MRGQVGYTLNATTDAVDWYRTVLPQGGSFEFYIEGTATSGGGNANLFATIFRANAVNSLGTLAKS